MDVEPGAPEQTQTVETCRIADEKIKRDTFGVYKCCDGRLRLDNQICPFPNYFKVKNGCQHG